MDDGGEREGERGQKRAVEDYMLGWCGSGGTGGQATKRRRVIERGDNAGLTAAARL